MDGPSSSGHTSLIEKQDLPSIRDFGLPATCTYFVTLFDKEICERVPLGWFTWHSRAACSCQVLREYTLSHLLELFHTLQITYYSHTQHGCHHGSSLELTPWPMAGLFLRVIYRLLKALYASREQPKFSKSGSGIVCGNLKKIFRDTQLSWWNLEIKFDTECDASQYRETGVFLSPTALRAL